MAASASMLRLHKSNWGALQRRGSLHRDGRSVNMKAGAATTTAGSDFDEFLYAPIWEERNGMLLSMLSALARLNVDPWDEAARLARLPREAATRFLTTLISALPDAPTARADPRALAERLIALLPQRVATNGRGSDPAAVMGFSGNRHAFTRNVVLYIILTAFFLGAQWLMGHAQQTPLPAGADARSNPPLHIALPASAPTATTARDRTSD